MRSAYLVVPAITVLSAGATLMTLAAPRPLVGVRVHGGPTESTGHHAVRLACVRRDVGIEDAVPLEGLEIRVAGEARTGACNEEGVLEVPVVLTQPLAGVPVRVTRGGEVLVDGVANVARPTWASRAIDSGARLPAAGSLPLRASVDGGAMPVGRWSLVRLTAPQELRLPGALRLSAAGATVGEARASADGLVVPVMPTFVTASLSAERALDPPGSGGWEVRLPVAPASLYADDVKVEGEVVSGTIRSIVPRKRAYVRIETEDRRVAAAEVPLGPDGRGGAFGELRLPGLDASRPAWLVVTDVAGGTPGSASVGWPLPPIAAPADGRVVPDALWLDGLAPIAVRERERIRRATLAVVLVVAAGALLEALLLADRGARAKAELRAHLAAFGEDGGSGAIEAHPTSMRLFLAIAAMLFGFALLGLVLVVRM